MKTNKLHGLLNWKIFMCWYIFQAKVIFRSRFSGSVIAWACSGFNFHSFYFPFYFFFVHLLLGHILCIFLRLFLSENFPPHGLTSPFEQEFEFYFILAQKECTRQGIQGRALNDTICDILEEECHKYFEY